MTDLLKRGVEPEITDVVGTGNSSQAGPGRQKEGWQGLGLGIRKGTVRVSQLMLSGRVAMLMDIKSVSFKI